MPPDLHFWRDSTGHEVDVLIDRPEGLQPVEIKSGTTWASDWPDGLRKWRQLAQADASDAPMPQIVYGGSASHERQDHMLWSWRDAPQWANPSPSPAQPAASR